MPVAFRADLRPFLEEFVDAHRGVRLGRMFGAPGLFAGRRLFACLVDGGLIVKLPADVARRELQRGALPYERRGSRVRAWVIYRPRTSVDARRLWPVLELAVRAAADLT